MKYFWILACILTLTFAGTNVQPVQASGGTVYTVQPGDTLFSIAAYYGITIDELLAANNLDWNMWVQAGQQLVIPGSKPSSPQQFSNTQSPEFDNYSPQSLNASSTQGFVNGNWGPVDLNQPPLSTDQTPASGFYQTNSPSASLSRSAPQTPSIPHFTANGEKWIDVNLTTQTLTAHEGQTPVFTAVVSTGTWQYPTVVGTFSIYVKYEKARMRGGYGADAYDLPDVPYVMYFQGDYGLHGTYWHNNFGTPMSHGCVNLSIPDSEWLFNWAPIGTKVVVHY